MKRIHKLCLFYVTEHTLFTTRCNTPYIFACQVKINNFDGFSDDRESFGYIGFHKYVPFGPG